MYFVTSCNVCLQAFIPLNNILVSAEKCWWLNTALSHQLDSYTHPQILCSLRVVTHHSHLAGTEKQPVFILRIFLIAWHPKWPSHCDLESKPWGLTFLADILKILSLLAFCKQKLRWGHFVEQYWALRAYRLRSGQQENIGSSGEKKAITMNCKEKYKISSPEFYLVISPVSYNWKKKWIQVNAKF